MRYAKPLALPAALLIAGCQAQTDSAASGPARSAPAAARSAPKPTPAPLILAEGAVLAVRLETSLSSKTSQAGDLIVARLVEDVKAGDKVVLVQGSEVRGRVTAAVPSGKVKGRARLAFDFDKIVVDGKERIASLKAVDITAPSSKGRDAKVIGGGAGAGLVIGALADGKKGAAIGTAVGAAAGTGVVLATPGKEVTLPSGTTLRLKVEKQARL